MKRVNAMKLVTFEEPLSRQDRVGALWDEKIIDTNLAYALYLRERGEDDPYDRASAVVPAHMIDFLKGDQNSEAAVESAVRFVQTLLEEGKSVRGPRGEQIVFESSTVRLRAPVPRPGKIIHTAGNFREHADEGKKSGWEFPIPQWISFPKSPSAVIGHEEAIIHPKFTKQLDHEIELAIIIGRRGKYIKKEEAYEYIAGYTVFNDITARDIQRQEMKSGLLNFGKNLDTFAPMGPCLVLKDEIPDPHNLKIECRVNGEVRQSSNTNHLFVKIPEIVEHYSWVTLEPGDIITTGTVSGVAAFRPNPERYYLKPGDILESEIERIGVLRNPIIAEK